jgi:glycosyltransferase involved in cell wall biosynthesis
VCGNGYVTYSLYVYLSKATALISVIIPAFNEQSVISKTITSVLAALQNEPGELIVACNGCVDRTFEIASSFGERVSVLHIEKGSKIAALNEGDRVARFFPRFYLDADILLSANALSEVASVLRGGVIHAAAPKMDCVFDRSSWGVRAFYKTWLGRPYHSHGHVGSGFVGLSEQGRGRFDLFPDIIADDEFLRRQFGPEERKVVNNAWFSIRVPQDLKSLVKVKTRSRLGTIQLENTFPELTKKSLKTRDPVLLTDLLKPNFWAYAFITVVARERAKLQWKHRQVHHWERDETSRNSS